MNLKIVFSEPSNLTHEDIMEEDNPFNLCEAFIHHSPEREVFFAAKDIGDGPFWIRLSKTGVEAFAPCNLELTHEVEPITPEIVVKKAGENNG